MSATNRPTDHCYLADNAQSDEHPTLTTLSPFRATTRAPSGAFSFKSVAGNSTRVTSIESALKTLSNIFWVYADWIKPRPASAAKRTAPVRDIAVRRFV
jgi:hypothetical protein